MKHLQQFEDTFDESHESLHEGYDDYSDIDELMAAAKEIEQERSQITTMIGRLANEMRKRGIPVNIWSKMVEDNVLEPYQQDMLEIIRQEGGDTVLELMRLLNLDQVKKALGLVSQIRDTTPASSF